MGMLLYQTFILGLVTRINSTGIYEWNWCKIYTTANVKMLNLSYYKKPQWLIGKVKLYRACNLIVGNFAYTSNLR